MLRVKMPALVVICLAFVPYFAVGQQAMDVHEDYFRGFAQGAYYGLMLAGEDYHVAWCMKAELEGAAKGMGSGAEFQRTMEWLHEKCISNPGMQ